MHDPLWVRVSGPLQPCEAGYAAELGRVEYTTSGAILQLRLVANLSAWLEAEGPAPGALSAAQVDRFLAARRAAGQMRYASARAIQPPLEYLRRLGVVPEAPEPESAAPLDRLLARYRRFLTVERGLAPTAACGIAAIRPFLASRATPDGLGLKTLTVANITAFVVGRRVAAGLAAAGLARAEWSACSPSAIGNAWRVAGTYWYLSAAPELLDDDRHHQRDGDVAQALPAALAVDAGGLERLLRERL